MTRLFSLNRGPDYPTFLRIGRVPRFRKVQYSRLGVSRGPAYPLPTETERVSAARKTHITPQVSLSRGPDYPTVTRIEAVSMSQKAQIRRACTRSVLRISTALQTQLGPTHQYGRDRTQHPQLEQRHNAEQAEWQREQGQVESLLQQSEDTTFVSVNARESSG